MNKNFVFAGLALLLLSFVSAQATPVPTTQVGGLNLDGTSWMFIGLIILGVVVFFFSKVAKFVAKIVAIGALILLVAHLLGLF